MKTIQIEIPKGHEIDQEQSNLSEGKIVFKEIKNALPKTWEEIRPVVSIEGYLTDDFLKAEIAMRKLFILRNIYRDGWKPNWMDASERKYGIMFLRNSISDSNLCLTPNFLSFQSPEIRDEFLNNFASLIETAKPLMS